MEFHPIADLFPLLEGAEFDELAADIKAHGLIEPIWLYDNLILDGRNRHCACLKVGVEPRYRTWEGTGSLVLFVISENLKRRHLSDGQKAFVALKALPALEAEAKERQGARTDLPEQIPEGETGDAREKAATAFKVNPHYVSDAKKLEAEEPELAAEIKAGRQTIPGAKRVIKEREREQARARNRQLVKKAPTVLEVVGGERFQTLVLDPPWSAADEGDNDQLGRAQPVYATMPLAEIAKLPVNQVAAEDSHCYLWITNRSLPKGFALLEGWGFRYVTMLTWVKPSFGTGNYFRGSTEHVLFGIRGSLPLLRKDASTHFEAPRCEGHSVKPALFYSIVETCSPGPWLEFFSREQRNGWTAWGAEV